MGMETPKAATAKPEELWQYADSLKRSHRFPDEMAGIPVGELIELVQELGIARKKLEKVLRCIE